ncbi:MAG: hypothetical protein DI539_03510 [Flavobacterium psychrophilum]|nr:MAG: hypothetical protein DI539_03510 [Flavobacterium psychrophilum]
MRNFLAVIYKYFSTGASKDIAYEKTISVFLVLIFINIFTILIEFDLLNYVDFYEKNNRSIRYAIIGIGYFLPGYYIVSRFIRKKDLENVDAQINLSYDIIVYTYMLFTFLFFILAIISINQPIIDKSLDLNY